MTHFAGFLLLVCLHVGFVYGMDCSFGTSKNFLEKIIHTCPGILDSSDKSYCCYDINNESAHCCTFEEFMRTGLDIIVPAVISAAVVILLIACCISCLCCRCCPWYRRRHQGTVYGQVQPHRVVNIITPTYIPTNFQPAQNQPTLGPISSGMPQSTQRFDEAYAKQAPYNPTYVP